MMTTDAVDILIRLLMIRYNVFPQTIQNFSWFQPCENTKKYVHLTDDLNSIGEEELTEKPTTSEKKESKQACPNMEKCSRK